MSPAIHILSLNPALDVTYEIPHLVAEQKAHALHTRYDPGGNGINVGRAMKKLAVPATTWGVLGGEIGHLLQHLLQQHLGETRFYPVEGVTRINGTALETETGHQYEISGVGPDIPPEVLSSLLDAYILQGGNGYAVLTGSLQASLPEDLYAQLSRRIRASGGLPVIDCHDTPLRHAVTAQPFLIKPNQYELEQLLGTRFTSLKETAQAARELVADGVEWVCVSMGEAGALLIGQTESWLGHIPKVEVRCTVGAGDATLAGIVAAFAQGKTAEEALRLGLACGVGTVQQPGSVLFEPEMLSGIGQQINVQAFAV